MDSQTQEITTRSDKLLAKIFRHDLGSPLQVITVSLDSKTPVDSIGLEKLREREKTELEEMAGFMAATYERLNAAEDIRVVENELEHMATEFEPANYDGVIAEYVDKIRDISSLVNDYVKSTAAESEENIPLSSVLSPLENYGVVEYNDLDSNLVYGDQGMCVVANTVGLNALDHGEKENGETEIWAEVTEEEDLYQIDIWDNGSGLDDEKDPEKIFEKGNGDNSGLGLYLAKEITELFDGNIEYSQENAEKEDGFGLRWELKKPDQYLTSESS